MSYLDLAWAQIRTRLGAMAAAVVVIALGVGLAAGMLLANHALREGFARSTGALAGRAHLTVRPYADGTVEQGPSPIAWAGAMFYPGAAPMAPVDLSRWGHISFSAKGDGGEYEVLLFSQSKGDLPAFELFTAGPAWKRYRFALADFDGINTGDVKALMFASNRPGRFALQIDQVEFE